MATFFNCCYSWICVFAVWCCIPGNCQFQCFDGSVVECGGAVVSSVNTPEECCHGSGHWFRIGNDHDCMDCANTLYNAEEVCNERELNILLCVDNGRQQVIQDVLDILSTVFLEDNNALPDEEGELLDTLYNALAHGFQKNASKRGFNQFMEAVNEIAVVVACANISTEIDMDTVPELVREFRADLRDRSYTKYQNLRSLYGRLLRIRNSLSNDSSRHRRQSSCECPPDGLNGEIFHPCQFFDCLNPRDIEPIFGFTDFECLAFVVDTTGSMKDEIQFAAEIIKSFIGTEGLLNEVGCYMFVPFNDVGPDDEYVAEDSVGPLCITYPQNTSSSVDSLLEFVECIETSFRPDSGGDCPEYAYDGLLQSLNHEEEDISGKAFKLLDYGSQVIVLTDAPSKQSNPSIPQEIINLAQDSGVCIHFFLGINSFNCFEEIPNSKGHYKKIAEETGGIMINSLMDFSSFVSSYKDTPCWHLEQEFRRKRSAVIDSERCKSLQVSSLASALKLVASLSSSYDSEITITKPDNSTVNVPIIDNSQPIQRIAVFTLPNPMSGEWLVCAKHGSLEVLAEVTSLINAVVLYGLHPHNDSLTATPVPPPACTIGKVLLLSSQNKDILSGTLNLVNDNGVTSYRFPLRSCSGLLTGVGTFPLGDYTFHMEGVDLTGNSFLAKTKRKASFSPGNDFYRFTSKQPIDVSIDQLFNLTMELSSTNPYGGMMFDFNLEDIEYFSAVVNPTSAVVPSGGSIEVNVTAVITSYEVQDGSSHVFTVTASNQCFTLSSSATVIVKHSAPTVPPTPPSENICGCQNGGTCLVIVRRGRQLLRCDCLQGFRGRRCERGPA